MAQSKKRTRKLFKPLAIAALMVGGALQPFMLPAFAAAGDTISNTATATYTDDDPTNVFTTESNTVTVTIKEIAGITVTPEGVDDDNLGSFEDGDTLFFNFDVTNVGNDTSDILFPEISEIGAVNFDISEVCLYTTASVLIGCYDTTATGPQSLVDLDGGTNFTADGLPADTTIRVVVEGVVLGTGLNPGDEISVTLGDTNANDNEPPTQNQVLDADGGDSAQNVRTDDIDANPDVLTDVDEKEASAFQDVEFATQQTPLALATVRKIDDPNVDPGPTGAANDDIISYELNLTVEDGTPDSSFIAEALEKTLVNIDGGDTPAILVSDAIPEFTELYLLNNAPAATAAGWEVVYSYSPLSTSPVVANGATPTEWIKVSTTAIATPEDVTRIGYIYEGAAPIEEGTFIEGFTFDVITNGLPAAGGNIYNLAQVFGTTFDDETPDNGLEDPIAQIIYDESGDPNPNNFDGSTPPTETDGGEPDGSDYDPGSDLGVADPDNHGTDDGSNEGSGPDGEDNVVPLTGEELTGDDNILNGPDGSPSAVGETDDDDDYTNQGVEPVGSGTTDVVFTNTVANPATNTSEIDNVTIQPISAAVAAANDDDTATDAGKYEETPIPDGTIVTISYDPTPNDPTSGDEQEAEYTYTAGAFTTTDTPVNIGTLEPGEEVDYTVTVDFPADVNEGDIIEIPLIAFPDTDNDGYVAEVVNNITVDRIYAGFMTLEKEARLLDADGITVLEDWGTDLTDAESGNIIEYRITYQNTSGTAVGSGNVGLDAENFQVIEDGDAVYAPTVAEPTRGPNNWHNDVDADALTVHATGTTVSAGTVEFFSDYADGADVSIGAADPSTGSKVEAYINEVGTVVPGGSGTLTFRRQVN